ncbi:MAG TPA: type I-C CRISPR-associated protein Cas7/Csd2, partial [Deltaproteobacteria bacterium]|nr:type I-C CRISPR-associated protein Cas7/Csd2 [Deltaproteobacteria bacterium]
RNYLDEFRPTRQNGGNGFEILIKQGAVIETCQKDAIEKSRPDDSINGSSHAERAKNWLCREFYDVRTFGGVLSTGSDVMKGSAYGQVRGPVQFTFGQSFHPITPMEITITRCAVTKEDDKNKERTMGNKNIVPYALYAAKGYVSPAFAEKTGFTIQDLELLFEALQNMFEHDRSAARGQMETRALVVFKHDSKMGNVPAHTLFNRVKITRTGDADKPARDFSDYTVSIDDSLVQGVAIEKRI